VVNVVEVKMVTTQLAPLSTVHVTSVEQCTCTPTANVDGKGELIIIIIIIIIPMIIY